MFKKMPTFRNNDSFDKEMDVKNASGSKSKNVIERYSDDEDFTLINTKQLKFFENLEVENRKHQNR